MVSRPDYFELICQNCGKSFKSNTDGCYFCSEECKRARYQNVRSIPRKIKLEEAERLYKEGHSMTRIEREVGVALSTVSKHLRNKGYDIRRRRDTYTKRDKCLRKDNSLAVLYPEIAAEWCYELNNKSPESVYPNSAKLYWWKCPKPNHPPYRAPAHERVNKSIQRGCPYCAGKLVSDDNRLSILYPEIAAEWHITRNGQVKPSDVSYASNKKYWWTCPRNPLHVWQTSVSNRTYHGSGTGCPHCRITGLEFRVYSELKFVFADVKSKSKVQGCEVDILLPSINIGIEVDGEYWHRDRIEKDREKNKKLQLNGITLIRVRDIGLPIITDLDIQFNTNVRQEVDDIRLLKQICERLMKFVNDEDRGKLKTYIVQNKLQNNEEYVRIIHGGLTAGTSLREARPDLADEWDYEKNYPLTPDNVTPGMRLKVGWLHKTKNGEIHRWNAFIYNRTSKNGRGCNICSSTVLTYNKSLAYLRPDVAKEWHPTLNGDRLPENTFARSGYKATWICPLGHEPYQARVADRTDLIKKRGCPVCSELRKKARNIKCLENVEKHQK